MNTSMYSTLRHVSKASKHAHLLRASMEKILSLLPEAHETWHNMVQQTRHIELHLEAIQAIFEEMLHRDPALYATLLLLPEERRDDTLHDPSDPFGA